MVADQQTAGRGRGSNRWWTGAGGLAFSLLVDAETVAAQRERSPLVSLAAALAVADAVAPLLPPPSGHPLAERRAGRRPKLAGILVEVLADRRHVIGIGLNTNNTAADAPAELQTSIATLRDLSGRQQDQTALLIDLLGRLEQEFARAAQRRKSVAARADQLCLDRGRRLTLTWAERQTAGLCRGIAAEGGLLLETPAGLESFHSGTVSTA